MVYATATRRNISRNRVQEANHLQIAGSGSPEQSRLEGTENIKGQGNLGPEPSGSGLFLCAAFGPRSRIARLDCLYGLLP